ncbi:MAG: hypothetical protein IT304_11695 [Dehalococcoidia bacterium]|nr:hypothetical protein [Dehalococcoidia bacterium]
MANLISQRLLVRAAGRQAPDEDDLTSLHHQRERLLTELEDIERRLRRTPARRPGAT